MNTNTHLFRVLYTEIQKFMITKQEDFEDCENEPLPGPSSFPDGISWKAENERLEADKGTAEDMLKINFTVSVNSTNFIQRYAKSSVKPRFLTSISKSQRLKYLCTLIYTEWYALQNHNKLDCSTSLDGNLYFPIHMGDPAEVIRNQRY